MRLNYDELSPITGNMCVMVELDATKGEHMKLCMESGYQTFDSWKDGTDIVEKFLSVSPELVKTTKFIDDNNNVWVKIIMMTPDVVLNPDLVIGEDDNVKMIWKVSTFRLLDEGVLPDKNMVTVQIGDRFKVLDEDTCSIFDELDFENATLEFYSRIKNIT